MNLSHSKLVTVNKTYLLLGVLLFLLGSVLVVGSYYLFNKYALTGAYDFPAGAYAQRSRTWEFPEPPLQLGFGDTVTVKIFMNASRIMQFYVYNTERGQIHSELIEDKSTVYYFVKGSDLYSFLIEFNGYANTDIHTEYRSAVTRYAPNRLTLILGVLILLSGAATIPVAFLYRKTANSELPTLCYLLKF